MVRTLALLMLTASLAACATTGATPSPFPRPGTTPPRGTTAAPAPAPTVPSAPVSAPAPNATNNTGYEIAGTALSLRGTPYRTGGSDPNGFDCSGLVYYVFGRYGLNVPRTVAEQFQTGRPIDEDELQPGDLVFFATVTSGASHVGIAIGGDEFVDAPSGSGEVRVEHLSSSYWKSRFLGARRIL